MYWCIFVETIQMRKAWDDQLEKDTDGMDMPCMCECGNWFDLNDGYRKRNSNIVVCERCHEKDEQEEEIENEIEDLENQMDSGDIGKREGKRRIKELKEKLFNL